MGDDKSGGTKINRRLEGEPLSVGDSTVQPVSRLEGWQIAAGDETGGFSGFLARLIPLEVVVRKGDDEYSVPVVDPEREPLRGILMGAVAVSVVCLIIMLIARRIAVRKAKS